MIESDKIEHLSIICENCRYFYYEGKTILFDKWEIETGSCKYGFKEKVDEKFFCNGFVPNERKRFKHTATKSFNITRKPKKGKHKK